MRAAWLWYVVNIQLMIGNLLIWFILREGEVRFTFFTGFIRKFCAEVGCK